MARTFKIVVNREGYPVINGAGPEYVNKRGKRDYKTVALHRAVVMDALGITGYGSGYHVHHCDSNRLNCDFDNLILVSADTRRAIHLAQIKEGRCFTKEELLASPDYDTNWREFDVTYGDYNSLLHADL